MHKMIEIADDVVKEVERIPLSFSISRILSNTDEQESRGSSEDVTESVHRLPKQHGAKIQYYTPLTETGADCHFECNAEPRACSTPETEYPSPTLAWYPLIFRPFPVSVDTYRPSPYTVPTRSYVGLQIDSDQQDPVQTSAFYAVPNYRNVDGNDEYDSNRSTPETESNFCTKGHSDKSLDSLGESYHQSPSPFKSKKKKKLRTVFSRSQIYQLEAAFDMKRYLTNAERAGLAVSLKLSETQIKIWFQNRRNKWKRQINGEMDEIPIHSAFASRFLQNGLYHMNGARADLVYTGPSLPAHVSTPPYKRESLLFPYQT